MKDKSSNLYTVCEFFLESTGEKIMVTPNGCKFSLKRTTKDQLLGSPHKDQPSSSKWFWLGFNLARHKGDSDVCLPETNV